ncbi:hypothetical protein P168DRAFT_289778 [Aspergillus campestris IBT 28561]|uniref:HD domain-containing protein n=1 Tax=Aspergillus campestris (strain IBT 28561) TaxID=1392248 RepID=A0A2I1D4V6_ASPC2|nr:uncharacterized protein P168DRAFT_289778 [Aspergillus campestris IBT 28561]PKY04921.1 hypothetical protein P168DRAFT_289778 [Aspergillus campestris IBT 28561]
MCNISHSASESESPNLSQWIPQDKVCQEAFELARSVLPPAVLNHSLRVWVYAKWLAERMQENKKELSINPSLYNLLFVACIHHDLGCTDRYNGPERFEIEGADASVEFLKQFNFNQEEIQLVWQAIALHTTSGIAERSHSFTRLVRLAVRTDFHSWDEVDAKFQNEVEQSLPRLEIEKVLGDAVANQAINRPNKAPPNSWPAALVRAKLEWPDWEGVNKGF